jgi:hypothetical protein
MSYINGVELYNSLIISELAIFNNYKINFVTG